MSDIVWTNVRVRLGDLKPWSDNPRLSTKAQARRLLASFEKFGQVQTVAVDPNCEVLDGHQRLSALLTIHGAEYELDARQSSRPLTDAERRELVISLHAGAVGSWDWQVVSGWDRAEIEGWTGKGFVQEWYKDTNNDANNLKEWMRSEQPSADAEPQTVDATPELIEKWNVKRGDMFAVGNHRLICGDATDPEVIARVLDGDEYSVLTDPPYNIGFTYEAIDDEMNAQEYAAFCRRFFDNIVPNSIGAIITPGPKNERLYPEPRDKGIWVKPNATAGASCFHLRLAEPIMFYGKFEAKRNTDVFEYSSGFDNKLTEVRQGAGVADKHAPAKSMPLWEELIKMLMPDVVLDIFGGNGTTMLACERLGRKCRMSELSEAYCAVILERMSTAFPALEIRRVE
jgi:hypothetical protein